MKYKEIEVVESIIQVLNKCFLFHLRKGQFEEARKVLKDIQIVRKEIKRLKEKPAAENAHNG